MDCLRFKGDVDGRRCTVRQSGVHNNVKRASIMTDVNTSHVFEASLDRGVVPATTTGARIFKRAFDIVGATTLLLLLSPIFMILGLCVATTKGPIFYGHERLGYRGNRFKCYKFRSMVPNADKLLKDLLARDAEARAEWEQFEKLRKDPRITGIGRILRKTSLDELPQLWNVLCGDMSLVGPRPMALHETSRWGASLVEYTSLRPGITGLWQINGRTDSEYDSRIAFNRTYLESWTPLLDLKLLFQTVRVVFSPNSGAY
ncbi:sugar transferase [Tistrella sp.]|nr:sugar transferase [Tistrella sp.]|tara:strand:+ start:481 stop:1257 length:777 start_codon:yes stop_codon:yes gene_type:complete